MSFTKKKILMLWMQLVTLQAVTKGYTIGSAGLGALDFLRHIQKILNSSKTPGSKLVFVVALTANPFVVGSLVGGMLYAGSMGMQAVGRAEAVVIGVRDNLKKYGVMKEKQNLIGSL